MLSTSSASVLQIFHTVQENIVLPAIYQDIGVQKPENAKAVNKMPTLIQVEKLASTVLMIDHYGTATNASHVQQAQTSTPSQVDASYAHQDSHTTILKSDAHAHYKLHTCIRTTPV